MSEDRSREKRFPVRTLLLAVGALCAALLFSGAYSFVALRASHRVLLENRINQLTASLDFRLRRGGRRADPAAWQELFDETVEVYGEAIDFLAIIRPDGRVLAYSGRDPRPERISSAKTGDGSLMFFRPIGPPGPRLDRPGLPRGRLTLAVGLPEETASFVTRISLFQLAVAIVAIATLIFLSTYFLRTHRRLVSTLSREESEKNLKVLGQMAATLAHEIRNPLGAMKGLTQIVKEQVPADHQSQELMDTVVTEAGRLENLVTDLLSFARPRPLKIQPFSIDDVVHDVLALVQPRLEDTKLKAELEIDPELPQVHSDREGIQQVLLNVVLNAVEASPEGGRLRLSLVRRQENLEISVIDSGRGLNDFTETELFEPFRTSKTSGSGLGLAISRRIVERLGGSIALNPGAEGGVECTIRLPLSIGDEP